MVQSNIPLTIDQVIKEKVDEMQKGIDNDVMRACLVESGWTQVEFYYTNNKHAIDVLNWIGDNVKENQWSRLNSYFVFRKKKDAEWFMLRWL
jgi:hypothetical protein